MSFTYPETKRNPSTIQGARLDDLRTVQAPPSSDPSLRLLTRHALTTRRLREIGSPAGATGLVKALGGLPAVLAELRRRAPIDGGEGER